MQNQNAAGADSAENNFAINNVQLLNRMRSREYSQNEIEQVNQTYAFAVSLFACRFEPSGRPFFSHIVRTAGLLVEARASLPLICAALLHNVYQHGEFGSGVEGKTPSKRQSVRAVVGQESELLIDGFATRPWNPKAVCALRDELRERGAAAFSQVDRDVITLKIADHLEHELDFDPLYATQSNYKGFTNEANVAMQEMSEILGALLFAQELQRVAAELENAPDIPADLRPSRPGTRLNVPASYRTKFAAAARGFYVHRRRDLANLRYRLRQKKARA